MCSLCQEYSIYELCENCINTADITAVLNNKLIHLINIMYYVNLNIGYLLENKYHAKLVLLLKEICLFKFLIKTENKKITPNLLQFKHENIGFYIDFIILEIKMLRRLLLLIIIKTPLKLLENSVVANLTLLQTSFTFFSTTFNIFINSVYNNEIISDLISINHFNRNIDTINLNIFTNNKI